MLRGSATGSPKPFISFCSGSGRVETAYRRVGEKAFLRRYADPPSRLCQPLQKLLARFRAGCCFSHSNEAGKVYRIGVSAYPLIGETARRRRHADTPIRRFDSPYALAEFMRTVSGDGLSQYSESHAELGNAAPSRNLLTDHSGAERPDHRSEWCAPGSKPSQQ